MKRLVLMLAGVVGVVGCGDGGGWKETCSPTKQCPAGNYCATTSDGSVCWPDATPPEVHTVAATCGGAATCRRDGVLRVTAVVTDDQKVGTVEATLGLDPAPPPFALTNTTGDTYEADIALLDLPFPYFQHNVTVTVTAKDGAQNPASPPGIAAPVTVTREAWARKQFSTSGSLQLWSPAVMPNGLIVVAAANGQVHMLSQAGTHSPVAVTSNLLNGPAAVGSDAIWVGSEDGRLYRVTSNGSAWISGAGCNVGEALKGAPATRGTRAVSVTKTSFVVVADSSACVPAAAGTPAQPVISSTGHVLVPAAGKLGSYTIANNGALVADWSTSPEIGQVTAQPAIDGAGSVWTNAGGSVYTTGASGNAQSVSFSPGLAANSSGGIILADGAGVFGSGAVLRRSGAGGWSMSAALTGGPAIPLALSGGDAPSLLVATDSGYLYLLKQSDGSIVWQTWLTGAVRALEPPNIWTEPGAKTSTAYLAGADGYLYGVIVDGTLDTSAPWPKAYHDPQNTSNAGTPLAGATP